MKVTHITYLVAAACSSTNNSVDVSCLPHPGSSQGVVQTALQIAIGVIAAISLLFITIGGLRYVLSEGDPQAVSKAKGTVLYALIGLAVALVAQAIVVFVIGRLG